MITDEEVAEANVRDEFVENVNVGVLNAFVVCVVFASVFPKLKMGAVPVVGVTSVFPKSKTGATDSVLASSFFSSVSTCCCAALSPPPSLLLGLTTLVSISFRVFYH